MGAAPGDDRWRHWPPHSPPRDADAVPTVCATCGLHWQVHVALRGMRLRCDCGSWIAVPDPADRLPPATATPTTTTPTGADPMATAATPAPRRRDAGRDPQGRALLPTGPDDLVHEDVPTSVPLAPGALEHANVATRARWTNRALIEFSLLLLCIVGPQVAAGLLATGREEVSLLPLASLAAAVLVTVVLACSGPTAALGFRGAAPRHWLEALLMAGLFYGLARALILALIALLGEATVGDPFLGEMREALGTPAALLVLAVAPAVLEEIAFRGVLQGRLLALFGRRAGLFLGAVAFTLCHGSVAAWPLLLAVGCWLGWLRERCGSLLPGMLLHFAYNGLIVLSG